MKKLLSLFLGIALSFALCACQSKETESGTASSVPEDTTEESKEPFMENAAIAEIRSYFDGNIPDRTMKAKNLFAAASYSYSAEPTDDYGDPNRTKLNDGIFRDLFDKWNWVGFKNVSSPSIYFDLGETAHALADVEVDCLKQVDYGIYLPTTVTISVSDDGENYTLISTLQTPSDIPDSGKYTYRFAFPETLSARYIKITLTSTSSGFLFIDEITGYEYSEDGTIDVSNGQTSADAEKEYDLYGYTLNSEITVPVDSSDSDYNTLQNLALLEGVDVQVKHFDPMEASVCASNTPKEQLSMLIDGVKASRASYSDPAFVHFTRGYGRHIVIDLGNSMAVEEVCLQFLNQVSVGVGTPPAIMISVSNDGESWITTYAEATGVYGDAETQNIAVEGKFKQSYRCRYIRVSFNTVPHNDTTSSVYLSEIEVFGKKNAEGVPEAAYDKSITMGRYPDPEDFGCSNLLFAAINGRLGEANANVMTKDAALTYLAYLDDDGNIIDTFMDSVCFSASSKFVLQSDSKESVNCYLDDCFAENQNLAVLENTAAQIQQTLNREETVTIWFNLFCPKSTDTCSDVNGDGNPEDLSTAEGRFAFLKYQVDQAIARFNEAGFAHLELLGFYWNDECLYKEEIDLNCESIRLINDYIHSLGYKSFWCPYFNAYGIWLWEEIGFDFAVLQPNYMFYATDTTRLTTAADTAMILGMSVELEIEDYESQGSTKLYREYLRQGYDSGYIHSIKLYYQGGTPGALALSHDSSLAIGKAVYDDTYQFAKELLDDNYNIPVAAALDQFVDVEQEVVNGGIIKFSIGDTSSYTIRILQSTLFGTPRIDQSGEVVYRAMKGFRGEDVIVLEISDGTGNRKQITLTIHVTE